MKKLLLTAVIFSILLVNIFCQSSNKLPKYLGETFKIDSVNKLLITVQYNADLFSSKLSFTDHYSNLIFYDYINETQKKLFKDDTYIRPFRNRNYFNYGATKTEWPKNITNKHIFMFVFDTDSDGNKKITNTDPARLYKCELDGSNLAAITPENENAVSFELFSKEGFILVKMQRDLNSDKDFNYKDKDFYYLKIDLNTSEIIHKIELD